MINSLFQFLIMRMVSFLASLARKNTIREACALFASFFILFPGSAPVSGHLLQNLVQIAHHLLECFHIHAH